MEGSDHEESAAEPQEPGEKRRVGFMPPGSMSVPDDFDTMGSEEIAAMFDGDM